MPRTRSRSFTLCCWLCTILAASFAATMLSHSDAQAADAPDAKSEASAFGPLLVHEDFSKGLDRWEPTDAKAWKLMPVVADKEKYGLSLFKQSDYKPKVRSPLNYNLLKEPVVGDFQLDVKVVSTGRDYGHRDVCLIFGHESPSKFYYVHLARNKDDHANQIFIVNDAPRVKISKTTTEGTAWDDAGHMIRVQRKVDAGTIAVFWDDMEKPVMTAEDKTFAKGRVGIGSFDDTADFFDVKLFGQKL